MLEMGEEARKHKRGALFESVALSAAAIAFGCVAFADFLNHTVKTGEPLSVAANKASFPHGDGAEQTGHGPRNGVDYSATGSIIPLRQAPSVSPCGKN